MSAKLHNSIKKIEQEWEKILFFIMLAVTVIFFFVCLFRLLFSGDAPHEFNVTGAPQKSFFSENAFAFLYGVPMLEEDESPFSLKKSFPKPKNNRYVSNHKKPPRKPKPPKQGDVIGYNGWMTIATGEKLAFVKMHDLRTKKLIKRDSFQNGESIGKYMIKTIDDEKLTIEDSKGKLWTVPIYKQITIMR